MATLPAKEKSGMSDIRAHCEKLRTCATDCENIAKAANDPTERELFSLLAQQLGLLVAEIDRVITAQFGVGTTH